MKNSGEYRVIFTLLGDFNHWDFQDLETFEQAQKLITEKKQQGAKDVFLRQHVVVTIGGKARYNTRREADKAAAKENAKSFNSASVSVLHHQDCPGEILYG
ncbi:MAG: hypothetical protein A2Y67_04065 [Candidatus Buchananbacteria bacterium RBG_13_39_9]|uniref:Uncharacterized protein n=1 Tax=Candidatus Buchananbacteria bacterium RBG_13_39_9 TaxID=1797531 RepID=A0A1G1XP08_9BACT|nr:MAG: hypothetical protein A2Y67_04065 [Candidatus Buchananbacteria bacterium RBG_13_39_9]